MLASARVLAKTVAGHIAMAAPQARFERGVFVLSHMRAASTALTNVLCSHPMVSGYGETHVSYDTTYALGQVLVNLAIRRAYSPAAPYFSDKLLHNGLDSAVPNRFFDARGLFLARLPEPAIVSITRLASRKGMEDMQTAQAAALYYAKRLERLALLWDRFPAERRLGFKAEDLLLDPDRHVDEIGSWLKLTPKLENRYRPHASTQKGGGGDPTASALFTRIEPSKPVQNDVPVDLDVSDALRRRCHAAHDALTARFVR